MKLVQLRENFNHSEYDNYLKQHIGNVNKAYEILTKVGIFDADLNIKKQISQHDASKYQEDEYNAYGEYFYGNDKQTEHGLDFKYAWLQHQHRNPHHWQYWLLKEDDSDELEALDIPDNYIKEMICDWLAFSISKQDINELFTWYRDNKSKQIMTDKTRKAVEKYLDNIKAANIDLSQEQIDGK